MHPATSSAVVSRHEMRAEVNDWAWGLPPDRVGTPAAPDLLERRKASLPAQETDDSIPSELRAIAGVPCWSVGVDAPRTILYFHGGGYRLGDPSGWIPLAKRLSASTGARVVVPDYRLAPEQPFPAALHDAASVYEALGHHDQVVVAGDSAGGGLAAAVIVAALQAKLPLPSSVVLISPWLDLTVTSETYRSRADTDRLFSAESAGAAAALYLQGQPADHPLVSPLHGELTGFPRTLLLAGTAEVLLDDSLMFARRLAHAGVTVDLHIASQMPHVFPVILPDAPESQRAMTVIASFLAEPAG